MMLADSKSHPPEETIQQQGFKVLEPTGTQDLPLVVEEESTPIASYNLSVTRIILQGVAILP